MALSRELFVNLYMCSKIRSILLLSFNINGIKQEASSITRIPNLLILLMIFRKINEQLYRKLCLLEVSVIAPFSLVMPFLMTVC